MPDKSIEFKLMILSPAYRQGLGMYKTIKHSRLPSKSTVCYLEHPRG